MLFWLFFISFIILLSLSLNKKRYFIIWIIFALVGMFRYRVGTDYIEYENIYDLVINGYFVPVELLYQVLIHFVNSVGGNPQLVFFLTFGLTTYLFYTSFKWYLRKLDKPSYMLFAIFLYLLIIYFFQLTSVRQILAISIFFFASRYIYEKKLIKYLFLMVIASLFHMSVAILIPFYFLANVRIKKFSLFIFASINLLFIVINPLPYIFSLLSLIGSKYARFAEMTFYLETGSSEFKIILTFITIGIVLYFQKYLNRESKIENLIFNMMLFFILSRIVSLHMDVVNRISNLFKPFLILFIIIAISKLLKIKNQRLIILPVLILLLFTLNSVVIAEKAKRNGFFDHYTVNLALFGNEKLIIPIYGNHENYRKDKNE